MAIVELLIVIIVIAILAGITFASFTAIQRRAWTGVGQNLAEQVEKKASAYHTVRSSYPADYYAFASVEESTLEGISESQLLSTIVTATTHQSGQAVSYIPCGSAPHTGARIAYWDFTGTPAAITKDIGTGC